MSIKREGILADHDDATPNGCWVLYAIILFFHFHSIILSHLFWYLSKGHQVEKGEEKWDI